VSLQRWAGSLMLVAFDLDGTLDTSEAVRDLMRSLHQRGDKIAVLTGCPSASVTPEDVARKEADLANLGLAGCYDKLKVYPNPPGQKKARWCAKHGVALLIDNSLMNAQLAPTGTTVLVPWKTITG
jgi:phosphoserine phosphatase